MHTLFRNNLIYHIKRKHVDRMIGISLQVFVGSVIGICKLLPSAINREVKK